MTWELEEFHGLHLTGVIKLGHAHFSVRTVAPKSKEQLLLTKMPACPTNR